jgi:hypothetical protein
VRSSLPRRPRRPRRRAPRPPRTLAAALAVALALAGCAGDGDAGAEASAADVEVRPLDDVLDSSIVVTADPSGTSAEIALTTSIPLACHAIFGVDESFGNITNDPAMGSVAMVDHNPVLTGLEPETDYVYVLQGSDAAGNLYRSEVLSFTTPAADPEAAGPGTDVAPTGEVVAVSSEFSDAFAGANAIDGDPLTEWSSAGDGDDASITIELPDAVEVVAFATRSRAMNDGTSIIDAYEVTVDDGEVLGPFEASPDGRTVVEVAVTGQRFTFDAVDTSGGNTGFVAIEILVAP